MPPPPRRLSAAAAHGAFLAQQRFGALDGLRALAILAVLIHHSALARPEGIWSRGFLGVDLFFVISGLLITTLLLRERDREGRISLSGFYWRRGLRILPLYLLVVTAVGGYFVLWKGSAEMARLWPGYYLFLANFLTDHIPTLPPTWSLSMEEQFYLVWPLVMLLPRKFCGPLLLCGIALNLLAVTGALAPLGIRAFGLGPFWFQIQGGTYAPLLIGAGLALLLHSPRGFRGLWWLLGRPAAHVVAGLLLAALCVLLPQTLEGWPYLLLHLLIAGLLASLVLREDGPCQRLLQLAPLGRVGTVSYGIYLLHLIVLHAVTTLAAPLGLAAESPLFLTFYWGGAYLLAELSFRFYESRFLRLKYKPFGRAARGRYAAKTRTTGARPKL